MSLLLLFWWFVFLSCNWVDGNSHGNVLKCSDLAVYNLTVSVHGQAELDHFMEQAILPIDKNTSRCIQLSLTGDFRYRLDIVKMMQIQLGTAGGLIVVGAADGPVEIDCVANISDILEPISNTSFVIFDGLKFVNCPVPILIEEVSLIVVQNCDFM